MKKILVLTTVYMALLSNVFAQTLKADVEADKVPLGEVFYLNLSYDGKDGASLQPDLSGLQNDFTVYSTSSSSQMNYINGFYISADNINKHPLLQQGFNSLFQFMSMDINDVFGTQKPVELYSKTAQINVLPEVADYGQNWWLPAENLKFEAMWTEKKPLFMVGETVAREIALTVLGVADTQLPELSFTDDKNFRLYPENPQFNTEVIKDKVVSQAVTRVVYIPQKNGEQILPELKLQWFNVRTKKIETAVIPAEKVFVEGHSVEPETKSMSAENTKTQVTEQKTEKTEIAPQNLVSDEKIWIWVIVAFLVGLLISFLFRRPQAVKKEENKSRTDWKSIIRRNLDNKDYRALRDNLILWGNTVFKDANISNLQDLAKAVKQDNFENQLQNLNKILYGGENVSLDASIILQVIRNSSGHKNKNETEELLPKLYK